MKKIQIFAVGAIAALAVSCTGGGNISTNVPLKTSNDTLSYAYGTELASKGLEQYLFQMGVLKDTAEIKYKYMGLIEGEADAGKKEMLKKEMGTKMDSLQKANKQNLNDFFSGIQEGINTSDKKASYMRGVEIGAQLKQMSENFSKQIFAEGSKETINTNALLAGIAAVLKKEKVAIENASVIVETKMQAAQEKAMAAQEEKLKEEFADDIAVGEKFLSENKSREGVVTLPSGLQYEVIKEGNGPKPTATDRVRVHYHGTLPDGTVFDSSVDRGEPAEFGVGQVIKGWTEALQLMPVGSKWKLYIPYDLAYGSRGSGQIKPFSPLVFDVELLGIDQ